MTRLVASRTTEIQGHSQVWRARHGGPPSTASQTSDANLDCVFVTNAIVFDVLKTGGLGPSWLSPSPSPVYVEVNITRNVVTTSLH